MNQKNPYPFERIVWKDGKPTCHLYEHELTEGETEYTCPQCSNLIHYAKQPEPMPLATVKRLVKLAKEHQKLYDDPALCYLSAMTWREDACIHMNEAGLRRIQPDITQWGIEPHHNGDHYGIFWVQGVKFYAILEDDTYQAIIASKAEPSHE